MARPILLTLLLLSVAAPAFGQAAPDPADAPVAEQTSSRALRILMAQAAQDENAVDAVAAAERYAAIGGSLSQNGRQLLRPFMDAAGFAAWTAALDTNALPLERSAIAFGVDRVRLVEAIAPNPAGEGWFVTAVADGGLWQGTAAGPVVPVAAAMGHGGAFGIAGDGARGTLWVAHAPVPEAPAGDGFVGVAAYDAVSGEMLGQYAMPDADSRAGDITLDADGNLFIADSQSGAIYRLAVGDGAIRLLANSTGLASAQGIAVDEAGQRLYVADYGRGIAIVPLNGGPMQWLASDVPTILDGTDGLFLHDGALIGIQNGTIPHRIARWTLSADGTRVIASQTLERAHRGWDEPTQGVIVGNMLHYVGNSQWRRFGEGGVASTENPPVATEIRRLPLTPPPEHAR